MIALATKFPPPFGRRFPVVTALRGVDYQETHDSHSDESLLRPLREVVGDQRQGFFPGVQRAFQLRIFDHG